MGLTKKLATWAKKKYPDKFDYDADGLKVQGKNPAFLHDPKFMEAYLLGINSGHKFGDIHVEWRTHVCCWAAHHASRLEGDFVECGTNTGIQSRAVCKYIDFNSLNKSFYLFDTFCGIPLNQANASEKKDGIEEKNKHWYEDCYDLAKRNFCEYPRAKLIRGIIPESFKGLAIEKVCYLHIDLNIVYPETASLEFFWDKIVSGGVIIFDDYGWKTHEEQQAAHDEFAKKKGVKILNLPTAQGLIIKP